VFLRESLERQLERERAAILNTAAITLQRNVRGFLARTRYTAKRQSAIKLQAAVRGWIQRRRYVTFREGVIKAQATFRGRQQRKRYNQLKACTNTVSIQLVDYIKCRLCLIQQEEMKRKASLAKERARVKAQKEEQERNARPQQTVPSLNTLDIPAELALIFNKIEGKKF